MLKRIKTYLLKKFTYPILRKSNLFDDRYYLSMYYDVLVNDIDPLKHFIKFGVLEGRNPNNNFDSLLYLKQNPDVAKAGINPLLHYYLYGKKEGN